MAYYNPPIHNLSKFDDWQFNQANEPVYLDQLVVHKAGTETITGNKTFTGDFIIANTSAVSIGTPTLIVASTNTTLQQDNLYMTSVVDTTINSNSNVNIQAGSAVVPQIQPANSILLETDVIGLLAGVGQTASAGFINSITSNGTSSGANIIQVTSTTGGNYLFVLSGENLIEAQQGTNKLTTANTTATANLIEATATGGGNKLSVTTGQNLLTATTGTNKMTSANTTATANLIEATATGGGNKLSVTTGENLLTATSGSNKIETTTGTGSNTINSFGGSNIISVASIAKITTTSTATTFDVNNTFTFCPTATVIHNFASSLSGFLLCDGTSYSTTTYNRLHLVIGYTFGGSGASFNVPNLRGAFLRGASSQSYGGVTYDGSTSGTKQADSTLTASVSTSNEAFANGYYNVSSGSGRQVRSRYQLADSTDYDTGIFTNVSVSFARENTTEVRPFNVSINYFIRY